MRLSRERSALAELLSATPKPRRGVWPFDEFLNDFPVEQRQYVRKSKVFFMSRGGAQCDTGGERGRGVLHPGSDDRSYAEFLKRLIIRPGAIGDFIVSIPAMECLRTAYLEVWVAERNVPLAERIAQHARSIGSTGLDLLEVTGPDARLLETLGGFDSIVSWYGANRPEFREAVAALRLPFQFFAALPPAICGSQGAHAVDFYLEQALSIAPCASDGIPRIACNATRGGFAAIHPFAGSAKKRWPLERFKELARRLEPRMPVEWCAGPEDELPGARRFDDLYERACWLARARIYIGNDSGPTHLAAAVGTPVVALFGPSDPAVWAPRGPHVAIAAASALDAITVEQVASLVEDTLRML